jgi:hypothetical protein
VGHRKDNPSRGRYTIVKRKFTLLIGIAIGYVLGSAAGRQRYEQLKAQAKRAAANPKVHEAAAEVQHRVTDTASKFTHAAMDKAMDKVKGNGDQPEPAASGPAL